jgi:hypothetical protein
MHCIHNSGASLFSALLLAAIVMFSAPFAAFGQNTGANRTAPAEAPSLVGKWAFSNGRVSITTEFRTDGTFSETDISTSGTQTYDGQFRINGAVLGFQTQDFAMQVQARFDGPDHLILVYPNGTSAIFNRIAVQPSPRPVEPPPPPVAKPAPAKSAAASHAMIVPPGKGRILLQRRAEPNENAFTVLVPKGWIVSGGVFNVNPLEAQGAGNSLMPKCDFSIMSDETGTVLIHWVPTWYYADLRGAPSVNFFAPGQIYQGMKVRYILSPREFLSQLFREEHPQAVDVKEIGSNPMTGITEAFAKRFEPVNDGFRKMGVAPMRFESLAVMMEYTEGTRRYREILFTTISDNRGSAFSWSNENTIVMRAPVESFEAWHGLLDTIRESVRINMAWAELVQKHSAIRAQEIVDAQNYISRVTGEVAANRSKANDRSNLQTDLALRGQSDYANPFTGEVERDSSGYSHRWENKSGDVLYTNEEGFDPNANAGFSSSEWRRSALSGN